MPRKTKLQKRVEAEQGKPLETLLPMMINERGFTATAQALGIGKPTLGYWLLKMGIEVRRVAVGPDEIVRVKPGP